ncbi:YadA-like family protein, partial [uncultured Psychrobacter sp.]|uniref:YadA family autotransporter adhesin n=1 Tax=uncultured Psychrobacter sp. TaxID=259303 RepID=UPI0025964919
GGIQVATKDEVTFTQVTTGDSVLNKDGLTFKGSTVAVTGGGINAGGNKITNVEAGVDGKDAVNVDQLTQVETVANAGWKVATSNSSTTASKVAPGAEVDFVSSDNNVAIKHTSDAGNTSIDFALSDDLKIGSKDGTGGTIAVNGKDGVPGVTIDGKDGSIGLTGPAGTKGTISVTKGVAGLDGTNGTRLVIEGNQVATMNDGLKFAGNTGATIAKKLNDTLTISGGLAAAGAGQLENASGANLRVDSEDGKLNLVMAKDLIDINSITINNRGPVISQTGIDMRGTKITNLAPGTEGTDAVNVDQLKDYVGKNNGSWNISDGTTESTVKTGNTVTIAGSKNETTGGNINVTHDGKGNLTIESNANVKHDNVTVGDTTINKDTGITVGDVSGDHVAIKNDGITVGDTNINKNGMQVGDTNINKDGVKVGDVSITAGGIHAGDNKITGVADGTIAAGSKDAVNGGQIHDMQVEIDKQAGGWELNDGKGGKQQVKAGDSVAIVGGDNIDVTIDATTGDMIVKTNPDVTHNSVNIESTDANGDIVKGPSMNKDGIDAAGNKVTSVADGDINKDSTDAVNGSQLDATNNRVTVNEGDIKSIQEGKDGMFQVHKDYEAKDKPKPTGVKSVAGGAGAVASGKNSAAIGNDSQATGENSTALGNSASAKHNNSVALGNGSETDRVNSVSVGTVGGERQITNVAAGVAPTDAVNVSQLDALGSKVNQYFNAANKRIDKVDNNARAGIAAAMAAGTLPQSTLPGKSMVTVGASTYRGESAIAIGVSRLSDNARTVIKANASADSRGNAGAAVGAGWHW